MRRSIISFCLFPLLAVSAIGQAKPREGYARFRQAVKVAKAFKDVSPYVALSVRKKLEPRDGPFLLKGYKLTAGDRYVIKNEKISKNQAVLEILDFDPKSNQGVTDYVLMQNEGGQWKFSNDFMAGSFKEACDLVLTR